MDYNGLINRLKCSQCVKNLRICDFQALLFKDRSYPEGDDVLRRIINCKAEFRLVSGKKTLDCVVSEDGIIYSLTKFSETDGYLYGKDEEEIEL